MWRERKVRDRALAFSNLKPCVEDRQPFVQSRRSSPKGIEEEVREVIRGKSEDGKRRKAIRERSLLSDASESSEKFRRNSRSNSNPGGSEVNQNVR
jgi:hypothetical protein